MDQEPVGAITYRKGMAALPSPALPAATARATAFLALHRPHDPVVLPNTWDAASARAVEAAGFHAVATSSAALAATLGYDDGEAAPVGLVLEALGRIVRAVDLPVTADVERGYGLPPGELVERLAGAGVVGCNLEDSDPATGRMLDLSEQEDLISAVRAAADALGVRLVLNARVDTFLHGTGTAEERLADAVHRGRHYLIAGADCVYPILLSDPEGITRFALEVPGPVNVLARPQAPGTATAGELAQLGVARISYGPFLFHGVQERLVRALHAIRAGRDPGRDEREH